MGAVGLSCMVAVGGGALFLITQGGLAATDDGSAPGSTGGSVPELPSAPVTSTNDGNAPGRGKFQEYDFGSGGTYVITDGANYLRAVKGADPKKCSYEEEVKSTTTRNTDGTQNYVLSKVTGSDGKIHYRVQNSFRNSCGDPYLFVKSCDSAADMLKFTNLKNPTGLPGAPNNAEIDMASQWTFVPNPKDSSKMLMEARVCAHNGKATKYLNLRPGQDSSGRIKLVDEVNASQITVGPS